MCLLVLVWAPQSGQHHVELTISEGCVTDGFFIDATLVMGICVATCAGAGFIMCIVSRYRRRIAMRAAQLVPAVSGVCVPVCVCVYVCVCACFCKRLCHAVVYLDVLMSLRCLLPLSCQNGLA